MDANIIAAIITSITAAASTSAVAITALVLNSKGFDSIEKRLDRIEAKLEVINTRWTRTTSMNA